MYASDNALRSKFFIDLFEDFCKRFRCKLTDPLFIVGITPERFVS